MGVNALWISSPLEQIHGWVGGGTKGDFPHYAYHGYYTQDWSKLDANMGTEADLRRLVDEAHKRGIRILFDVVMNHTGYATLADMQEFQFGSLYLQGDELKKKLSASAGRTGSRARDRPGTALTTISTSATKPGGRNGGVRSGSAPISAITTIRAIDDLTMSLAFLPDLKTESKERLRPAELL